MNRILRTCCALLLSITFPVQSQTLPQQFSDWANRFDSDMRLAELTSAGEIASFAGSQWSVGSSAKYLSEMQAASQLFPKPRNRRVWNLGSVLRYLSTESRFAGSGGSVIGAELNTNLPQDGLEVIYLRPPSELGDRLDSALRQRFGVDQLKVPPTGVFRRNQYPFLLFKRIDGKLYLAAFSREFMTVVDAIFTLQIAAAELGLRRNLAS